MAIINILSHSSTCYDGMLLSVVLDARMSEGICPYILLQQAKQDKHHWMHPEHHTEQGVSLTRGNAKIHHCHYALLL